MTPTKKIFLFVILVGVLLSFPQAADACPTCKDSIEHQWVSLQQGYALSILLMMGMPFSIGIAWAVAVFRMVKKGLK